jgi:ATP-dependent Clp protease adaptor protein ClpS
VKRHKIVRKKMSGVIERDPRHLDDIDDKIDRPRRYSVVLLNDDFTPMEFVEHVVMDVFRKTRDEAGRITMDVHTRGAAAIGPYTHELAETRAFRVIVAAEAAGHPLQATVEPID